MRVPIGTGLYSLTLPEPRFAGFRPTGYDPSRKLCGPLLAVALGPAALRVAPAGAILRMRIWL